MTDSYSYLSREHRWLGHDQRHVPQVTLQRAHLKRRTQQQPRALLAGTGGTAESMGVLLLGGGPHLEDERHVWVVHTARRDVGGEHDALFAGPKLVGSSGSGGLCLARMNLHHVRALTSTSTITTTTSSSSTTTSNKQTNKGGKSFKCQPNSTATIHHPYPHHEHYHHCYDSPSLRTAQPCRPFASRWGRTPSPCRPPDASSSVRPG